MWTKHSSWQWCVGWSWNIHIFNSNVSCSRINCMMSKLVFIISETKSKVTMLNTLCNIQLIGPTSLLMCQRSYVKYNFVSYSNVDRRVQVVQVVASVDELVERLSTNPGLVVWFHVPYVHMCPWTKHCKPLVTLSSICSCQTTTSPWGSIILLKMNKWQTDLMHSFPEDVLVFILVDVLALIVWFDSKLHLLHCPLLGVQLLQVLSPFRYDMC